MYANEQWKYTATIAYKTDVKINSFRVNQNDISLIIKTLDAKKAYGWDNILIKTIQICGDPIALILCLLLKEKTFPDIKKKANVVPVHKKEGNNLLKNYRPISLLPISSKVLKGYFIIFCLSTLSVTNFLHLRNRVFFQAIRV